MELFPLAFSLFLSLQPPFLPRQQTEGQKKGKGWKKRNAMLTFRSFSNFVSFFLSLFSCCCECPPGCGEWIKHQGVGREGKGEARRGVRWKDWMQRVVSLHRRWQRKASLGGIAGRVGCIRPLPYALSLSLSLFSLFLSLSLLLLSAFSLNSIGVLFLFFQFCFVFKFLPLLCSQHAFAKCIFAVLRNKDNLRGLQPCALVMYQLGQFNSHFGMDIYSLRPTTHSK